MSRMRTRVRPAAEDGLTLAELLVTMTLLVVVMGLVLSSTIVVRRGIGGADATNADIGQARVAMDAITRTVRAAEQPISTTLAVTTARTNELEIYSNIGDALTAGPRRVRYTIEPTPGTTTFQIRERITRPTAGPPYVYPSAPTTNRVVARGLVGTNIFRYYSTSLTTPLTASATTNLSATNREALQMVQIDLRVRNGVSRYGNDAVDVQGRVRLVNNT